MSYNERTKQKQQTKVPSKEYRDNWDKIFKSGFGLAEVKQEGGKLGPNDFLVMNGTVPPVGYYTKEELKEYLKQGYGLEWLQDANRIS